MKPEDILFNGWYYFITSNKTKKLFQVKRIYKNCVMDKDGTFMPLIHIQPIPLTTEILEKNGFKKELDDDNIHYRYTLITDGISFSLKYARSVFQWLGPLDFKYVHELQYTLRLCKIKKTIKL